MSDLTNAPLDELWKLVKLSYKTLGSLPKSPLYSDFIWKSAEGHQITVWFNTELHSSIRWLSPGFILLFLWSGDPSGGSGESLQRGIRERRED